RDIDQENAKVQFLFRDCSFEWGRNSKTFTLAGTDDIWGFVYQKLPMLRREMDVFCSKDFEMKLLNNKFFEPTVKVTGSGIDWFEFDVVYKVEGSDEEISHARFKKLVLEGQKFIRLKKGELLPIPQAFYDQIEAMSEEFDTKKLHLAQMPFVMGEIERQGLKSQV
ncbi:MAG: SNF2 helicase associated domain-containing protein, partial [Candidatus Omnitrophica bacterium]|nr:SNF2 helicase associated domain-containing protein [Candidatus Omnitrophota bacterium]